MTGSGLYLALNETDHVRQNNAVRQLIEGRSNAVGTITLAHDGIATSTTVTAQTCSSSSIVILTPQTAHAAAALGTTYVTPANTTKQQFIITHAATTQTDQTFGWLCIG